LGFEANITKWAAFFFEVAYEYEMLSVPDYRTFDYSRHRAYLAGRDFQTGGPLFLTGISLSYPARKERN
jgi:hypothetical protein